MAKMKITFHGLDENFKALGSRLDRVTGEMALAGGKVMKEAMKKQLKSAIGKNLKVKGRSTGELLDALGVSRADVDYNGVTNVRVGFREPRKKQTKAKSERSYGEVTNAMIANVLEYGKSGQEPRPFIRKTIRAGKKEAEAAMAKKFEENMK